MRFLTEMFSKTSLAKSELDDLESVLATELTQFSEHEAQFIVNLAGLLCSVADRDFELCEKELLAIETLLAEHTSLSLKAATTIARITVDYGKQMAQLDEYKYVRALNKSLPLVEREKVLRILFGVAIANDDISAEEEQHLGYIARDLLIDRSQFIQIRNEFAEFVAILNS